MVSGAEALHRVDGAQDGAADRLVGIGRLLEQIEDVIVGIVARGADLLDDHLLLAIELGLLEQRVLEDVGEDVGGERHVFLEHAGEVAGVLDRGRGVEVAADILDGLGDLRAQLRDLVPLKAMCSSTCEMPCSASALAARAGLDPDAEGGAFEMRHVVGDDGHAVVEGGGSYAQTNSSPPGSARE